MRANSVILGVCVCLVLAMFTVVLSPGCTAGPPRCAPAAGLAQAALPAAVAEPSITVENPAAPTVALVREQPAANVQFTDAQTWSQDITRAADRLRAVSQTLAACSRTIREEVSSGAASAPTLDQWRKLGGVAPTLDTMAGRVIVIADSMAPPATPAAR